MSISWRQVRDNEWVGRGAQRSFFLHRTEGVPKATFFSDVHSLYHITEDGHTRFIAAFREKDNAMKRAEEEDQTA